MHRAFGLSQFPLVSSIAFIAGAWLFFDIREVSFLIYAAIYLILGCIAMFVRKYLSH